MTIADRELKEFKPGTTGWTASDLDDPRIEAQWFAGKYEIVDGVLTTMPPAYFVGGSALFQLMFTVTKFQEQHGIEGRFAPELDIIISEDRVAVADAGWLTADEQRRQNERAKELGRKDIKRTRILIPPSLVIESISAGHERHDRTVKRRWYEEFGIPNYWLLNGHEKSLECLVLRNGRYEQESFAKGEGAVRASLFPGLEIRIQDLWPPA